jgi:hypothetical protein
MSISFSNRENPMVPSTGPKGKSQNHPHPAPGGIFLASPLLNLENQISTMGFSNIHKTAISLLFFCSSSLGRGESPRLAPSPKPEADPFASTLKEDHPAKKNRRSGKNRLDKSRASQIGESIRLGQPGQQTLPPGDFHKRMAGEK